MMFKFFLKGTGNSSGFRLDEWEVIYNVLYRKGLLKKHSAFRQRHAFATLTQEFPRWTRIGVLLMSIGLLGCRTMPPLPKVSLTEPGWTVRQGQAIWHPKREGLEIAGELLVATRTNGTALVQFTKTPFPLVVAQQTRSSWEIEFPTEKRTYSAPGHPPGT